MSHETFIWLVTIPLVTMIALLLIHKAEARRQRRNSWWRGR